MHARHFMQCLWNCVQFWICGMITVSLLQLVSTVVMLPPIFTVGHVLWVCCIVVPVISLTLSHSPLNPQVMQRPGYKVQSSLSIEVILFTLWCYGTRFLPTLVAIPFVYGITLYSYCLDITSSGVAPTNRTSEFRYPMVYPMPNEPWGGWQLYSNSWSSAQALALTLLVLHLVAVSFGFVHREYTFWRRSPLRNRNWLTACTVILGLQLIFMMFNLPNQEPHHRFGVPWLAIILAISSVFLIICVNELVKWQEIKAIMRYEKRARLDFGTKLGMNSPF